ncbi:MAG: alpha/beta fold hydrolase [Ginsengibacter sp.]
MRISLLLAGFILIYLFSYSQNLQGNWKGTIEFNGQSIPIVFHFYKDSSGNTNGKWDSPKQNVIGLPFSEINADKDSVHLGIKMINGFYNGKFIGSDSMQGIWQQGPAQLPLNFSRSAENFTEETKAKLLPNEKEIAVTIPDGSKLYGTLLSKNNNQKLVIIIAGSGPTDREGNNILGVESNSYQLLAQALDSENIASFRYDKRGIGKSIPSNVNEENLVFEDYINDAEKIFQYLQDSLGFKDIYILGHSEGSLIGIAAAEKVKAKGLVSIAGAGRPIDEIIEEQISNQSLPDSLKKKTAEIFATLKDGRNVNDVPDVLNSIFRKSVQPYMISWLKYDPAKEIKKLKCPVLILQGSCDMQTKTTDAENLHHSNAKSKIDIIPLMTHTLKNAGEGCKDDNRKTYTDPSLPLNKQLVNDIVKFIK